MIETKNRHIITELPHPETEKYLALSKEYEPEAMHSNLPVIWDKADNSTVWDIFGNKYIDFSSSMLVAGTGHCQVAKDIVKQSKKLIHSYTCSSIERIKFIKQFHKFLPDFCEKIYLASSGSEVTGWAEKIMKFHKNTERRFETQKVAKIEGGFHGKISSEEYLVLAKPEKEVGFYEYLLNKRQDYTLFNDVGGILIESYEGWSAEFLPKKFVQELVAFCHKHDIIVCFDEIQGGFYRTGKRFAYEHYEVEPDLICMGKTLGGGLPISALAGRKKLFNIDGMSSTHSANPLCCSAASSVLTFFEKSLDMSSLRDIIKIFEQSLLKIQKDFKSKVKGVNVTGLLGALIFEERSYADFVCENCMKQGLLVIKTNKESVKLGPPLTITSDALIEGLNVLYNSVKELNLETIK